MSAIESQNERTVIDRIVKRVRPRRAIWRQRLVEAEGGFKLFLRGDSALFVHLFSGAAVIIAGLLVGLTIVDWAVVALCIGGVLAAELFHSVIRGLMSSVAGPSEAERERLARMAAAGVMSVLVGAVVCTLLLFGRRLWELFGA